MKWSDVLARDDLVGGQVETQESGDVYRGPIASIEEVDGDGCIRILTEYMETRPVSSDGEWTRIDGPPMLMLNPNKCPDPRDLGDGRIAFTMPYLGSTTITPKGWGKSGDEAAKPEIPRGPQADWRIVEKLKPKGYAEIRAQDGSEVFHGPVESVTVTDDDMVLIRLKWRARAPLAAVGVPSGDWEAVDNSQPFGMPNCMIPFEIEETPEKGKRVRFGLNLIYLDEVEGINPARVKGLERQTPWPAARGLSHH